MLEKPPILDREYGVDQNFRNLLVTQDFASSRLRRNIVRQNLRFKLERFEQNAVATNLIDVIARKRHAHDLFRSSGPDLDGGIANTKTSTPNIARACFQVTGSAQHCNKHYAWQLLPGF